MSSTPELVAEVSPAVTRLMRKRGSASIPSTAANSRSGKPVRSRSGPSGMPARSTARSSSVTAWSCARISPCNANSFIHADDAAVVGRSDPRLAHRIELGVDERIVGTEAAQHRGDRVGGAVEQRCGRSERHEHRNERALVHQQCDLWLPEQRRREPVAESTVVDASFGRHSGPFDAVTQLLGPSHHEHTASFAAAIRRGKARDGRAPKLFANRVRNRTEQLRFVVLRVEARVGDADAAPTVRHASTGQTCPRSS